MASRDLPKSFSDAVIGWVPRAKKEITWAKTTNETDPELTSVGSLSGRAPYVPTQIVETESSVKAKNLWPIFTAGAGLFSDGYVNNSISTASTCLSLLYGAEYKKSRAINNVSSIAFAGTVLGQLTFGVLSDYMSRKTGMLISSAILIVFAILCSGSWGAGGSAGGLFAALTAYRFFLGVGIGAEYPTGSAACAEASALLPAGHRNRYFAWFTNFMIDMGFVVSAFVPMVMLWICGPNHLTPVWRVTLGLGAIPPLSLFLMRLKFKEGEAFTKTNFKGVRVPYGAIIKFYWFRLIIVAVIWWIYDFSVYAFGIYSSTILAEIIPDGDLYKTFGWNVVINLFYIPGAFLGALAADYIGPRLCLAVGVFLQAIIGYIMAGCLESLKKHIAGFVVVYGIFLTFGEFGPGDNIGLLASKTSATPIRGQYYGIAAATGKIGAFVGTYLFPIIEADAGGADTTPGLQAPFWTASTLAIFAGVLALFFLPAVDQDAMAAEDVKFLEYLASTGFDISQLGDGSLASQINNSAETAQTDEKEEVVEVSPEYSDKK
ncbi:unnamed protein product [Kuraishia capsulata CBS 1993]|uniref:Major facilitator superfamily (MFS) profile domain-containing protein n=1 Tax=Kuraishia capsulata CBS 1993 TaxID=1382522 RepID=W6MG75_9ASCO|nr:uncharacterized protein KUCA_T00000436001 [Kuraishia capsulata CBS 1993]CDK24473.1 unnamed protein product [Kuraishia capsulata CBS 1993]